MTCRGNFICHCYYFQFHARFIFICMRDNESIVRDQIEIAKALNTQIRKVPNKRIDR